ncbi:MAG: MBL fold metallo-hydrolase [Bradyrhizobium sp.]|uniref:MBL fold metallo-hydrolase n=1 Tax=Bradyrhizobium sp. TaxID=376 RepID=UPI002730FC02|nr:MBL fold metallo-hydrolase [Bradyrhizobium sp.]MDP1866779.1 MBL fold metallo-hydrolase [Bradyrhizobium sp.]
MSVIEAVDKVEIRILVDNATDVLSSNPSFVESEAAFIGRRGMTNSARCLCCAVHGLSCLVTVHRGGKSHAVLFDTGPEDYAFERNVTRLGVDLGVVESIVLSHGHWDHSGAMLLALGMIRGRNGARTVPFYAHPGMFVTRGVRQANGSVRRMDDVPSVIELSDFGAAMVVTTEPQTPLGGLFYVSGEILRVSGFERGYPGQVKRTADGWEPDELLMDERWLAVNIAGKGLVVLSACSHAGIVNVCRHARATFPDIPIHAVMGGLHLSGPNEAIIPQTVGGLKEFDIKTIAAGHCTGWRAMTALAKEFPDALAPTAVGKQFTF